MRRLPLCVVLFAATGGHASTTSADTRFLRVQSVPERIELSARVKPSPPPAPVGGTSAAAPRPSLDASSVLESAPWTMRPETEQILAQLIDNTPDSDREEKADYLFRLAEYYSGQVQYWTNQKTASQAADKAKMSLLKAVKTYKALTDNEAFRAYPKLDLALFNYGRTLQLGKYMKEARAVYDKLLKNFPESTHIPYAHLLFADYYYDAGQLADAEARYKQVLKFPKSDVYAYAMYKVGWLNLQLQRNQEALEFFAQVVYATRNDAKRKALHDAALHDFLYPYAEIGKPDKALSAFSRLDQDAAPQLVEQLNELLRVRGKSVAVITSYRDMLANAPTDRRACEWQYNIARATFWDAASPQETKIREIETLVKIEVARNGTTFPQAQPSASVPGAAAVAVVAVSDMDLECHANAVALAGEVAAARHAEWATTKNLDTLAMAERLYTAYVAAFPGPSPQQDALAEALWSHADAEPNAKLRPARWERAATAFTALGTDEAARAAALAWLNALDFVAPSDAKLAIGKPPGTAPRELALRPRDAAAVAAIRGFLQRGSAADKDTVQMRLAAAITLRRYRHYDEATTILDELLANHPTDPSAELAANLLLDSLVRAKSPDLQVVVTAMLADRAFVETKPHLMKNLLKLR